MRSAFNFGKMKITQFKMPVSRDQLILVQEDELPDFYEHLHRHVEIQITWIIKGEGTLVAGTHMHPFVSGDLFVIGSNQPHLYKSSASYFTLPADKRIHTLNIFFNPKGVLSMLLVLPEMRNIGAFIDISRNGLQAHEENARIIAKHITRLKNTRSGHRVAAFIELLQEMANMPEWKYLTKDGMKYVSGENNGSRMNDVYQYTLDNYMEDISLEQIAALVHLSPPSFCRYFKKHTLKTYSSFLNEVRINEACKKLSNNQYESISALAYQCGFNNVVTFNRVFKKLMKKSPRQYLREITNSNSWMPALLSFALL